MTSVSGTSSEPEHKRVCVGGWEWDTILGFSGAKDLTTASGVSNGFHGTANSMKRTTTVDRDLLIIPGPFGRTTPTLERLLRARERFPALCVKAIDLRSCNECGCDPFFDYFIVDMVGMCPEIENIVLSGCRSMTDVSSAGEREPRELQAAHRRLHRGARCARSFHLY